MEGDGDADTGTRGGGTAGCCLGKPGASKPNPGTEAELKALTYSILKKIKEKQLEVLLQAVESRGGARSPCLLLPGKVDARLGQQSYPLPLLLYKVFRWPDLRHSSELKRLSCCESYGKINPELVCCNPHHMSRLCELGTNISPIISTVVFINIVRIMCEICHICVLLEGCFASSVQKIKYIVLM